MNMHDFYASSSVIPPHAGVEPGIVPANVTANPLPLIAVSTIPPPEAEPPNEESNGTTSDESTNQPRQPILEIHPSQLIHDPGHTNTIPLEDYERAKHGKIRLTASLDCARYLIAQGEAFRGHDESSASINMGNFRELLDWYKDKKEDVKEAFDKGAGDAQMVCSDIQKDLAACCAIEVTEVIKNEIGEKKFSILIDEIS